MRILITNDDGINAPGLKALHAIAVKLAGPEGEVWSVAPAFEQSGVAHCISYTNPMAIAKLGERNFAAEGSPADCVLAALYDVMQGARPDLVLSGINRGNNAAENVLYSGTVGGAMEASLQGIPAIALSQFLGPANKDIANPYEAATKHGVDTIQNILDHAPEDRDDYPLFYNVNFPPVPAAEVAGTKVTKQGYRHGTNFSAEPQMSPSGRRFLWIKGGNQQIGCEPGTDVDANLNKYISITPMRADLTAHNQVNHLREKLER